MTPFINRIARAYVSDPEAMASLADTCFVFPNKRSATFFRQALADETPADLTFVNPDIITVSDLAASMSPLVVADRYEQLFTLYNCYRKLSAEVVDFDRFVFWGDMLLSDFNDVDMYMVDADALFVNLQRLNEINANFLTQEQLDVIHRYWNVDLPQLEETERFWSHLTESDTSNRTNRDSFVRLWEILAPLYHEFKRQLKAKGLCTSGSRYRHAARLLAAERAVAVEGLPWSTIVFVGFNVLSTSEIKIFEGLRDAGVADFYWDIYFPEELRTDNIALRFIDRYAHEFPSRYDIAPDGPVELPDIEITGIPSATGQAKYAASRLSELVKEEKIDPANALSTAIVLPMEDLFIETVHSIPPEFKAVNITMGYPLRLTAIARLLAAITSMQLRATRVRGQWCFFHEDIANVLANPLLNMLLPDQCGNLRSELEQLRAFSPQADMLRELEPELATIFTPVDDLRSAGGVFTYTLALIDMLDAKLGEALSRKEPVTLERGFLMCYRQSVTKLQQQLDDHNIELKEDTFFHLIERTLASETVSFVGEPLQGLQIMGVLETRVLTFDTVVMLSMNERIFPRKHHAHTFIPDVLRRNYGMSGIEFQEAIHAYHFYRLISGARRAILLYDSRTGGLNSGDMSRYLHQLKFLCPPDKVTSTASSYPMPPLDKAPVLEVAKTPEIMAEVNRFRAGAEKPRNLSASSINQYLSCPLQFYFNYIRSIRLDDEIVDYIGEDAFGTILHEVAERAYKQLRGNAPELLVTASMLDKLIADNIGITKLITYSINLHYNRLPSEAPEGEPYVNSTPLTGEAKIVGNVMLHFMRKLFQLEKDNAPFYFIEGEQRIECQLPLSDDMTINFKGFIDRVNRLTDGTIQIVDYKTGADKIEVKKFEHLFVPADQKSGHFKAVLQLFLYAHAYATTNSYTGPIFPILYRFKAFGREGLAPATIEGNPLNDYLELNTKVMSQLSERLKELFNPDVPFRPEPHGSHCHYCKVRAICGQAIEKKY